MSITTNSYNISSKVFASRLGQVIVDNIFHEQSAFVGIIKIWMLWLLAICEMVDYMKIKTNEIVIFKIDFKKAYDKVL